MRGRGEFALEDHTGAGRIPRNEGELDVKEFRDIERTVVISDQVSVSTDPAADYCS